MTEDTIVQVDGMTASVRAFIQMGKVIQADDGRYLTTGKHPSEPYELFPEALHAGYRAPDPYSPIGLRMRGFRVLEGDAIEDNRVEIGGAFYRISEARKHGLI
ncbi:hypothetical protein [Burkholderia gladioli]|jgi:hypothetical protein|uniref:hypothetical protein n=1 Tax=Burkholderia gladioli TaxID=28095 RepID=UPI00163E7E68|nr:hypothetical protein [Burkholderia gladioli]MBU9643528.1 hypothetical protein [Burkholderia gladioli]